ncbi:hypothetical protein BCR36DRAFT_410861 [Piromyces finnis]|uniref:Lysosomal cobalamin transporter n=1 Tax=Piromyces finnis TaxID=1754191 RepID=A0A1Y1VES8_9FUNG|nr:hypothetical protein BCR36DRAFT_410861 [Piromyces finnis]|eukprot:ORX54327.1 hypothetical protein BCR36DRAFT_410861 [Piromyces finnis]
MASKGEFKRRFPKINNCCICLKLKTGVFIFTGIILLIIVINVLSNLNFIFSNNDSVLSSSSIFNTTTKIINELGTVYQYSYYIYILVNAILIVSLVLLIIGILKAKLIFLSQFKIVFLLYIIFYLIYNIFSIISMNNNAEEIVNILVKDKSFNDLIINNNIDEEDFKSSMLSSIKNSFTFEIFYSIIICALYAYYYVATCSLAEDIEESVYEEIDTRNLENN